MMVHKFMLSVKCADYYVNEKWKIMWKFWKYDLTDSWLLGNTYQQKQKCLCCLATVVMWCNPDSFYSQHANGAQRNWIDVPACSCHMYTQNINKQKNVTNKIIERNIKVLIGTVHKSSLGALRMSTCFGFLETLLTDILI